MCSWIRRYYKLGVVCVSIGRKLLSFLLLLLTPVCIQPTEKEGKTVQGHLSRCPGVKAGAIGNEREE